MVEKSPDSLRALRELVKHWTTFFHVFEVSDQYRCARRSREHRIQQRGINVYVVEQNRVEQRDYEYVDWLGIQNLRDSGFHGKLVLLLALLAETFELVRYIDQMHSGQGGVRLCACLNNAFDDGFIAGIPGDVEYGERGQLELRGGVSRERLDRWGCE